MKSIKKLFRNIRVFLLIRELKKYELIIGGFNNNLVRLVGYRFLHDWEIGVVKLLRRKGRVIVSGIHSVTSTATGITYTDILYTLK